MDLVSGNFTDIQISTLPQHGTVTLTNVGGQFIATYTPAANYSGPDSFGFVAIGPGGSSAEAHVAITVAGVMPVAPALTGTTVAGQPVIDVGGQLGSGSRAASGKVTVGKQF